MRWDGVVWCVMVWDGVVSCGMVRPGMVWHGMVRYRRCTLPEYTYYAHGIAGGHRDFVAGLSGGGGGGHYNDGYGGDSEGGSVFDVGGGDPSAARHQPRGRSSFRCLLLHRLL